MSIYWIVNLLCWGFVMVYAIPGAWSAAFGSRDTVRRGDPMRLAVFLVASLFVGHIVRWLTRPDDLDFWKALYVVGCLTALYASRPVNMPQ